MQTPPNAGDNKTRSFSPADSPPGSFVHPMPWRKHDANLKRIPAVAALNRPDYSRLIDLLDMAGNGFPRWYIRETDETIRKYLDYGSVSRWLQFAAHLIENELLYCCDDGAFLFSPRLCAYEDTYPLPPSMEQSLDNLKQRSADLGGEPDFFKAITPANQRQIVRRAFLQYLTDLRAQGLPVPPDETTDRRAYRAAHTAFKVAFLPLLRETGARALPLDQIARVWQPDSPLIDVAPSVSPSVSSSVTFLDAEKRDTASVTERFVTPDVTDFLCVRASQTPDPDSPLSSATPQKPEESHNNNSSSPACDNPEKRDKPTMSRFADVTFSDVTQSEADAEAERKAVVVAFLSEQGITLPDGVKALISRDVALVMAETPDILEIAKRQRDYLPYRKLDKGTWGGLWRKSIEGDWAAPDGWQEAQRAAQERARREATQTAQQTQAALQAQEEAAIAVQVEAAWEAMSDEQRHAVRQAAAERLPKLHRQRYESAMRMGYELPKLLRDAMDALCDEALREQMHLPPRRDKNTTIPSRFAEEIVQIEAAETSRQGDKEAT